MSSSNLPEVVAVPPVEKVVEDAITIVLSPKMCDQDESQGICHPLKFVNAYTAFLGD